MAESAKPFVSIIDPNSPELHAYTADIPQEIEELCRNSNQPIPQNIGQFVRTILESLALSYRYTLEKLREISHNNIECIHIVGGGAQNDLLCQFTANATELPVYAGPVEATAIGNILVQAMAFGRISSLEELRGIVKRSFSLKQYEPQQVPSWAEVYERFIQLQHL